jgi:hypothetical protein
MERCSNNRPQFWLLLSCVVVTGACGSDAPDMTGTPRMVTAPTTSASAAGSAAMGPAGSLATPPSQPATPTTPSQSTPPATTPPRTMPPPPAMPPAGMPTTQPPAAGAAPPPATPPGPDDGDPSKPVVSIPEVPCKAAGGGGFGIGKPNFKVDDRDLILSYPCNKHEGAPMTFILNLHGTTPVEQHFYQEGYFSGSKYVASHNLIIATPSSVVQQWGNGDDGKDLPYLMNIIDFVYKNLGTKFDIRSMWVGGHSWGAFYTAQFGCKPELADKVRGLIIMSGSPMQPACASKVSVIDTNAEMDIAMPLNQGNIPMQHGCKEPVMMTLGNNTQTLWPDCNKGFTHSNYLMLGKMHADFMDDVVVKSIVDLIKSVRP